METNEAPHSWGRTRVVVDVTNENIIMAGGVSGGIWKSINKGNSWEKLMSPEMLHNVTCLRQDKRNGKTNTWYYGTGEAYGNSALGNDAYFFGNGIFNHLQWNHGILLLIPHQIPLKNLTK